MPRRLLLGVVTVSLFAIASAGCGSGGTQGDAPATRTHSDARSQDPPFGVGRAQMVGSPDTGVQSSTMPRVTNGWEAHDGYRSTLVAAGVKARPFNPDGPLTTGLFSILRVRLKPFDQSGDLVEIPGAGTLKITKAPLGRNVASAAQKQGKIEFTSANGVTGTLHLKDDTVTLNP